MPKSSVRRPRQQALAGFAVLAVLLTTLQAAQVPDHFILGTNLGGITDYGTEPVWKDLMMQSRTWQPQREGMAWGQGWPLAVDSLNWISSLDAGQTADCPLFGSTSDDWTSMAPESTYVCTYQGSGTVGFWNAASVTQVSDGRIELRAKAERAPFLTLTATDPADPVRDIRIFRRDHEKDLATNPWHQDFLDRWRDFKVIRFMDWGNTNNSPVRSWSQRTRPNSQTQAMSSGVALEYMIDYCNRTGAAPWFCLPHRADDDYIRRFATRVRDDLDPSRTVYVEYSNEVWNSIFEQTHYCDSVGVAQNLGSAPGERPWESGWAYSGRRSGEIFDIWEEVFGDTARFVRVVGSQMNPHIANVKLRQDSVWLKTDALAIAPYFGGHLSGNRLGEISGWSVDQLLDSCGAHIRGEVRSQIQSFVQYLNQLNAERDTKIKLIAYEGGQHLSAWNQNQSVTELFTRANRHERMYDLYLEYFEQWAELGGKLFCNFSSVSAPGVWGAWGVLEYAEQDPQTAPKYRALRELLSRNTAVEPQRFAGQQSQRPLDIGIRRPSASRIEIVIASAEPVKVALHTLDGRRVGRSASRATAEGRQRCGFDLQRLPAGIYLVSGTAARQRFTKQVLVTK